MAMSQEPVCPETNMCSIKQGIRSTKKKKEAVMMEEADGTLVTIPLKKHHNIYVKVGEAKETIYKIG